MAEKKIPVEIGVIYEGERVRGPQMHVEFGGPKVDEKAELARLKPEKEIKDGDVKVDGPDIAELSKGSSNPLGILLEFFGKEAEEDLEPIVERRIHDYANYVQGVMHLNQRNSVWVRVSKESKEKGLSLKHFGAAIIELAKKEFNFIEKAQMTFITDPKKVKSFYDEAMSIYKKRDERIRGMKDEEVDEFYGCILCQSFSPNHICIISPERTSLCGAITWLDGRAAARIDPDGPIFTVSKGDTVDEEKGEFENVNKVVEERSNGETDRIYMYSMRERPHTSCGCFEAILFTVPEVDGVGIVDRNFRGETVNGLGFSTMAGQTGGGMQTEGFLGFGLNWMYSPKFISADGGWSKVVWMPSALKDAFKEGIPREMFDKIPTEKDVKDLEDLEKFLKEKKHPASKGLEKEEKVGEAEPVKDEEVAPAASEETTIAVPTVSLPASGGVNIILKNAKITAEKVIIKRKK